MEKFLSYKLLQNYQDNKIEKRKSVALVTGGVGRIGSIFTGSLLLKKNKVIVLSRDKKKFDSYEKGLPKNIKKNLFWYKVDFNNPNELNTKINEILKKFKNIDILVNNVCDGKRGKFLKYNVETINEEFWGTFGCTMLLTEKILHLMRKKKFGKIINIGSIWGFRAPKFKTYLNLNNGPSPMISSSKGALSQYSKHLASREAEFNITVNTLIPGFFPRKGKTENKEYLKSINSNIPLGRIGKLKDLVNAVDFLLQNDNSYFTGQSIIIDGGYSAW